MMNEDIEIMDEEEVYLCFVRLIGEENDGFYRYEFIFTKNRDEVWGENFEQSPCCLINDLRPYEEYVDEIHIVLMKYKLKTIQESCCFCYQDCTDGIVAVAYEDISGYEEYPENGRLVFQFGETLDDVSRKLAMKNVVMVN